MKRWRNIKYNKMKKYNKWFIQMGERSIAKFARS